MVSARNVSAIVIALVIAASLLSPINSAVVENTGEVEVDSEELTAEVGVWQSLEGTNLEDGSEEVRYYDDGTDAWETASEGTDYEMNYENGSVQFLDAGEVSAGDDIEVDYTYEATDGMTTTIVGLIPLFVALLLLVTAAKPMINGL